jgi:hypothetical protein
MHACMRLVLYIHVVLTRKKNMYTSVALDSCMNVVGMHRQNNTHVYVLHGDQVSELLVVVINLLFSIYSTHTSSGRSKSGQIFS